MSKQTQVTITEETHEVTVHEDHVEVVTVGLQGPPGPPGDADMSEVEAHMTANTDVHGIADTSQLATRDDLDNLEVLPEPGDDGDVLTLADGSPTWAAPEGGGGLDPDGDETITGDWVFDRENLQVGANNIVVVGTGASSRLSNSAVVGVNAYSPGQYGVMIGDQAGAFSSNNAGEIIAIGYRAAANHGSALDSANCYIGHSAGHSSSTRDGIGIGFYALHSSSGQSTIAIGYGAGRANTRSDRLIIHNANANPGNLTDPLIDGRFRPGTDNDDFDYSKGVKVNGHVECTDQLILHSPDGMRWAVTVDNDGNLSATEATEEITP